MKIAGWMIAVAMAALPVLPAAAESMVKTVDAQPGETLEVDLETGGSIHIEGWGQDQVSVAAEHHEGIEIKVERDSGGVEVSARFTGRRPSRSSGVRLQIKVPDRFDLELETTGGEIEITGVRGTIEGETMGGGLVLTDLAGTLRLKTLGGNIELSHSDVDGSVESYGGNVELSEVRGCIEAATMGGNVIYDNVEPCDDREVKITTMGGNISVPRAPRGADVETMGGNIVVEDATEYVRASTMGGNITIGSVDGWIRATTMGGDVEATMTGNPKSGRRDVRIGSMGGDVTLTLPDGLSMELDITLELTKNRNGDFTIESDFPVSIRKTEGWDYSADPPRKYIHGTATLGGGEHKVKIETVDGDIRLRRGG